MAKANRRPGSGCYSAPRETTSLKKPSSNSSRSRLGGAPQGHGGRPFESSHRPIASLRNSLQPHENESLSLMVTSPLCPQAGPARASDRDTGSDRDLRVGGESPAQHQLDWAVRAPTLDPQLRHGLLRVPTARPRGTKNSAATDETRLHTTPLSKALPSRGRRAFLSPRRCVGL